MTGPRYWWLDYDDGDTAVDPSPPERRSPYWPPRGDLDQLRRYRAELTRKAALQPRGSARRRETEKTLVRVTAQMLRLELRTR